MSKHNCRYSFILPTYNMNGKIETCLDSILSQTVEDFEVIVINDGSTDNTREIVEEYVKRDNRIKLFNYENKGVTTARNRGLEQANGEYIILVDPDDRVKTDLLENLEPYTTEGIDLIRFGAELVGSTRENAKYSFNSREVTEDIINGHQAIARWNVKRRKYAAPWIYCAKKDIYTKNNIKFPEQMRAHDDFATMPILIACADTVREIPYIGYEYIQHNDSIGHQQSNEAITRNNYDFIYAYDFVLENLRRILKNDSTIDFETISEDLFKRLEVKIFNIKPDVRTKFIKELGKRYRDISYENNSLYDFSKIGTRTISENRFVKSEGEDFKTDYWEITKMGDYVFNRNGNSNRIGLQKVRKIKAKSKMYYNDYLVFSNIDYNEMRNDENYRQTALEVLLSDTNLLMATGCHNGYVGDIIIDSKSGNPRVCFDSDIIYFTRELPTIIPKITDKNQVQDKERER